MEDISITKTDSRLNMEGYVDLAGTFLGKKIFRYDPQIDCSENDIENHLKKVSRLEALRMVAGCSHALFKSDNNILKVEGIPITEDILLDAALKIIKYADNENRTPFSQDKFLLLIKMCHKLFDKSVTKDTVDANEILMKMAYRQFHHQENSFNLLARSIYIYLHLWERVSKAKDLDVLQSIEDIIGVPYKAAIALVMALLANKDGFFFPYSKDHLEIINSELNININEPCYSEFLKWVSAEYEYYQDQDFDDFLNPLDINPVIDTKTKPRDDLDNVFIISSYKNLMRKISSSIYFNLIDKYNLGGGKNDFKVKFGYVFEEYIGVLLKEHLKSWNVSPEIKYKKSRNLVDSVDWLIFKDNKLLLIEVKQSSIFLKSKNTAHLEDIKADLKKTLLKAVKQLERTINDIKSKKFPEFSHFKNTNEILMLIVTNDPLYNANYIGKKLIAEEMDKCSIDYDIINISDLEVLLANQSDSQSLFDILAYKKLKHKETDFKELLLEMYPDEQYDLKFLKTYYDEFFVNLKTKQG